MAEVTSVPRKFKFKKGNEVLTLDDPNPNFTKEEVLSIYSGTYLELTTATVGEPELKDGVAVYEFKTTVGTKG